MAGVLEGIRVLDFGRYIAGPYCATLLAEFGAEVIRVEKRDGSTLTIDASRAAAQYAKAEPQIGKGVVARGTYSPAGVLDANTVLHAKASPTMWYPDR